MMTIGTGLGNARFSSPTSSKERATMLLHIEDLRADRRLRDRGPGWP